MTNPLNNDTCVYVEWTAGDGGNHQQTQVRYWSPDINIVAPTPGKAVLGVANTIRCVPRAKAGCTATGTDVIVEAWVANPGIAFTPRNAELAATSAVPIARLGPGGVVTDIQWTPTGTGLQVEGHRCLILRVFPDSLSPSRDSFFFEEGDRHIAQHNIDIIKATNQPGGAPGAIGPGADGKWHVPVSVANTGQGPATVGIIVDHDPAPSPLLMETLETTEIPRNLPIMKTSPPVEFTSPKRIKLVPWRGINPGTRFPDGLRVQPGDRLGGMRLEPGTDLDGLTIQPGDILGGQRVAKSSRLVGFTVPQGRMLGARRITLVRPLPSARRMRWGQLNELGWQNLGNIKAELPRRHVGEITLDFDLSQTPANTAQIYHAQQIDPKGRPQGGLTIVIHKID